MHESSFTSPGGIESLPYLQSLKPQATVVYLPLLKLFPFLILLKTEKKAKSIKCLPITAALPCLSI